jgi:hypothetical protein
MDEPTQPIEGQHKLIPGLERALELIDHYCRTVKTDSVVHGRSLTAMLRAADEIRFSVSGEIVDARRSPKRRAKA